MTYIVVVGYDKRSGLLHTVAVNSATGEATVDYGYVTPDQVVVFTKQGGVALNFSVDSAGKLVQDCGQFTRFSQSGSAVITAEIKSKRGKTLGYRLLSCANCGCATMKTEDIIQREQSMPKGEHFLQNGIIRGSSVVCYPGRKFQVVTVETRDIPIARVTKNPVCSAEKILSGTAAPPSPQMLDGVYESTLDKLFKQANAEIKRDRENGDLSTLMRKRLANMTNWLLQFPEGRRKTDRRVDALVRACHNVPAMKTLMLDDSFCRMCPGLDSFIESNAMQIIDETSKIAERVQGLEVCSGAGKKVTDPARFDVVLSDAIAFIKRLKAHNGGELNVKMYPTCGNLVSWVVSHPEPLNVRGINHIRNELPDVALLLFDDKFCKQYCPSSDKFFDEQAVKLGLCGDSKTEYDAMEILAGRAPAPVSGIRTEAYIELLNKLIFLVKKRIIVDDNKVTQRLRGHIGHMLTWVTQVPESKRAVSSMRKIRDEIPQIGDVILDAGFCKEFPGVDAFFEANASALVDSSTPIEF